MSLSRHSSSFALTSSNRGSMNERERFPEKSSIGEISSRISSRPLGVGSDCRSFQAFAPTSHSNDSVCRARRLGTSSGSRSFAKETLLGVPPEVEVVVLGELVTAKMRPSKDKRRRSALLTAGTAAHQALRDGRLGRRAPRGSMLWISTLESTPLDYCLLERCRSGSVCGA